MKTLSITADTYTLQCDYLLASGYSTAVVVSYSFESTADFEGNTTETLEQAVREHSNMTTVLITDTANNWENVGDIFTINWEE